MELAIFLVIAVIVLVLMLVTIVFCRNAGNDLNEQLDSKLVDSSAVPSIPDSTNTPWMAQQPLQMDSEPMPPAFRMTSQQMHGMVLQQIQQMQHMQRQMWHMQQQMQMQHAGLQDPLQLQQPMNPYYPQTPSEPSMLPPQSIQPVHQQQQGINGMQSQQNPGLSAPGTMVNFGSSQDATNCLEQLTQHRLDKTEVVMTRKISTGSFGVVWLGHYRGKPVAIKTMIYDEQEEVRLFAKEILIMARLHHPKIVKFLGCTWTQPADLAAVTEFMTGGDLTTLLLSKRIPLSWSQEKISIAIDIAEALQYLHALSPKLIHRDLKSRNVLLDSRMKAKLSDFGLSRNRTYEASLTAGVGTVRWTAPEVMLGHNYSEQADIYSFGVVLSELDTREAPFAHISRGGSGRDMTIVIKVVKGELRPSFSKDLPSCIDQIAHACLQFDPALRPTAAQVVVLLNEAQVELTQ